MIKKYEVIRVHEHFGKQEGRYNIADNMKNSDNLFISNHKNMILIE